MYLNNVLIHLILNLFKSLQSLILTKAIISYNKCNFIKEKNLTTSSVSFVLVALNINSVVEGKKVL